MSRPLRQAALALPHRPARGRSDFLVSAANAAAIGLISAPEHWPGRRLALVGPAASGKTHLAHVALALWPGRVAAAGALTAGAVAEIAEAGLAVVEDADRLDGLPPGAQAAAEAGLLHLWNLRAERRLPLLVTARTLPGRWPIRLPDLASRLQTLAVARIAPPDDALLSSIVVKLFGDRQIRVGPEVVRHLVHRIERSFAAAEAAVGALDSLSLARKKPVTKAMVDEVLGQDEPTELGDQPTCAPTS